MGPTSRDITASELGAFHSDCSPNMDLAFIRFSIPVVELDMKHMSVTEYLREKAAESRHKESVGFSLLGIGMIMLIGGFLITMVHAGEPDWFLIIPWRRTSHPTSLISLVMTLGGFLLTFSGTIYIAFASSERSGYLKSLRAAFESAPKKEERIFIQRLEDLKEKTENLQKPS